MKLKKLMVMAMAALTILGTAAAPAAVMADATEADKTYISLGADLTGEQKSTVLGLLGVTEADLASYKVGTVTNAEEHAAFDNYLDKSVTGSKALSCAKVVQKEDGYGIQVQTQNIDYCTTAMYQNALATAGMKNADVVVAGPIKLSGTAALHGVTKAYSELTGEALNAESIDAAAEELVITSDVGDVTGDQEKAAQLIASVKEAVAGGSLNADEIEGVIDEAADQLDIDLNDSQRDQISKLMEKIDGLDLDINSLKEQASSIYDKLDSKGIDLGVSKEQAMSWFAKLLAWLKRVFGGFLK